MSFSSMKVRISGSASGRALLAGVSFSGSSIPAATVAGTLIGTINVTGFEGHYTVYQTLDTNGYVTVSGSQILVGGTPTTVATTINIGGVVIFRNGVSLPWTGSVIVTAAGSSPTNTVTPGTTLFGAWATTDVNTLGITAQGNITDFGYAEKPIATWTTPMFDRVTGSYIVGSTWWKAPTLDDVLIGNLRGMKEVWYSISGGPWKVVSVSETIDHPIYGNNIFPCYINSADFNTSRKVEVRAIGIPTVGQPFVLQGLPDPITQSTSGTARTNFLYDLWSLQLNIDKTGTALPHGKVYIDTTNGNDLSSGETSSTPVKTWATAVTNIYAQHAAQGFNGGDAGGGEIVMLAGTTQFGLDGAPDIIACADMPLIVRAFDGAFPGSLDFNSATGVSTFTNGDVHITASTSWGLRAEKIRWKGFSKSCVLTNADDDNQPSVNYFSSCLYDIYHDGGPGTLPYNQQVGTTTCFQGANGFNELFNVVAYRIQATGFRVITLGVNVVVDTTNEWDDPFNNPKALINVECRNAEDLQAGNQYTPGGDEGNHLDAFQWWDGRSNTVMEDLRCTHNWVAQVMLISHNGGGMHKNFALIRPVFFNSTTVGNFMALGVPFMQNLYILHPNIVGPIQIWDTINEVPPNSGNFVIRPDAINVRVVMAADSKIGLISTTQRYGKTFIYPSTTKEPDGDRITGVSDDIITTLFGSNIVLEVDANRSATVTFENNGTDVAEWSVLPAPGPPATPGASSLTARTGSPAPTRNVTGLNLTNATIDLNGINTGANSGASIGKGTSIPSIEGNNPVEIFMVLDQKDLITQTALRFVAAYGGTGTSNNRAIFKGVPTGGRNIAQFSVPKTGVSTSNRVTAPGDFSGQCVLHAFYNPTGGTGLGEMGIGLFNATQNTYDLAYYTKKTFVSTDQPVSTGAVGHHIGSPSSGASPFAKMGVNRYIVIDRNSTELERQTAIEYLLQRII